MIEEKNDNVVENIDGVISNQISQGINIPNVEVSMEQSENNFDIGVDTPQVVDNTAFAYTEAQTVNVPVESSNGFAYNPTVSPQTVDASNNFAYAQEASISTPVPTNDFAYAQETPIQTLEPVNSFAYAQETSPQNVVENADSFKFVDTTPAVQSQDNANFNYTETSPVINETPTTPNKYEPKVKFQEENREVEEMKDSYVFMIVFAIIMIAVVFAIPYLAAK